jgi:hypothetical protein
VNLRWVVVAVALVLWPRRIPYQWAASVKALLLQREC